MYRAQSDIASEVQRVVVVLESECASAAWLGLARLAATGCQSLSSHGTLGRVQMPRRTRTHTQRPTARRDSVSVCFFQLHAVAHVKIIAEWVLRSIE